MRTFLLLAFLTAAAQAGASGSDEASPPADGPWLSYERQATSRDYDIWYAIVSVYAGLDTAYVWHLIEPSSVFDRGAAKYLLERFPEARPDAAAWSAPAVKLEPDKFRLAAQRVNDGALTEKSVRFLDAETLKQIAGKTPEPAWLASPLLLPNGGAILRLSWPAYRIDGRAAYVICVVCTRWWGSVITMKVDKDSLSGEWRLGEHGRKDFTHWEDGKLFVDEWPPPATDRQLPK